MLHRLAIRDFEIVDALEVEFSPGLTVLTGETGAGKSILVDALQLALGGRGDAGVVREGAPRAEVTAEFEAPPSLAACFAARSMLRERAGPGSTAARRRSRSCAKWANSSSTSMASTPGKASRARPRFALCSMRTRASTRSHSPRAGQPGAKRLPRAPAPTRKKGAPP